MNLCKDTKEDGAKSSDNDDYRAGETSELVAVAHAVKLM